MSSQVYPCKRYTDMLTLPLNINHYELIVFCLKKIGRLLEGKSWSEPTTIPLLACIVYTRSLHLPVL